MSTTTKGQKYLGEKGLVAFLALLSAAAPLSTDLYLPALPTMTKYFNVQNSLTNLTLILFFIFYGIGTLIWGPLSDKYGRKPVLLIGLPCYLIAGALCAVSANIYHLIFFRVIQALGGSSATAAATAIVKDVYQGKKRESILAIVQSMVVVIPAVAPVIGAFILKYTSWRGIFWVQAIILGFVAFIGAIAFQETLETKSSNSIIHTIGRLGVVLKNPNFAKLLIVLSSANIPSMAFISASSYIYQETFKLSSQVYSYFFAFNAVGMVLGPALYINLSKRHKRTSIIKACFVVFVLSGLLVCIFGRLEAWVLAITIIPASLMDSCLRPPATYLMLGQQKEDAGSASSLISSCSTVMGSIGMIFVSLGIGDLIHIVGLLYVIVGVVCGTTWFFILKNPVTKASLESM